MAAVLVWGTLVSLSGQVAASERGPQEALPPPAFSHSSGFYQEGFHLTLTTGEPGAVIYYTLDGSNPDPDAVGGTTYRYKNSWPMDPGSRLGEFLTGAFHTYMYRGPFPVTERSSDPDSLTHKATAYNTNYYFPDSPVFKGTIVRARTIKEGFEPSQTITQVYFIHPEGRSRYHLPVISISINENHLFDYEKGIYTPGEVFDTWRLNHPHDQADGSRPANYHRRGEEWEYPAHFTYFDAHSTSPDLSQEVGIRIHGAWTRAYPMKSLRVYARKAYGNSTLDFPFFQDYPHSSFKRLILRNSGNDWDRTMFRDAMIQEVIRPLKMETQAHQPAVLFVNGEYWGMHNIRERFDKHYLHRVFGVEKDELDLLTHDAMIQEGGRVHYLNTLRFISDHDMASDVHFRIVQNRIDIENFIDYQVANIFAANTDWPGNNIDFWRKQTLAYEPESPYGHDGRWRWLAYDMDFGFGLVGHPPDHQTLAFATEAGNTDWPNPDWSTFLLRNLLQNEQFRHDFINRFADLLNTRFKTDSVLAVIDAHQQRVAPQMPEHIHRWKQPPNMGNWNGHVAALRHFASNRPERQRQQLRSFFGLPGYAAIRLNVSGHDHGFIRLNTLELHFEPGETGQEPVPWTGRYFQEVPIRLEAIPQEGYVFSHWEGLAEGDSAMFIRDPSGLGSITAHFTKMFQNPGLQKLVEHGEPLVFELPDLIETGDDPFVFTANSSMPEHLEVAVEGQRLVMTPIKRGDALVSIAASDGLHDTIRLEFRVLIYPEAFDFSEGDFFFGSWADTEPEHAHPLHMLFLQSDETDPGADAPLLFPYYVPHDDYHGDDLGNTGRPYALTRRTRINALGDQGVSFINTGRGRDLGGALLAIRTSGLSNLQVEWLAATILMNSRIYALRLQYRLGHTGDFEDLVVNGEPMVYVAGQDGESRHSGPLSLPSPLLDQDYVQLLWRYHHVSGESGPRSELRLDDIMIGPWVGMEDYTLPQASIYSVGQSIMIDIRDEGQAAVSVFNLQGRLVHTEQLPGYGVFALGYSFRPGIFIVRLETPQGLFRRKIIVN